MKKEFQRRNTSINVNLANLQAPQNIRAERQVVSGMLQQLDCLDLALERLKGEDFYDPLCRQVFSLCEKLRNEGKEVGLDSILTRLPADILPQIAPLMAGVVATLVFPDMMAQVKGTSQLRQLQKAAAEIALMTVDCDPDNASEICSRAESLISRTQMGLQTIFTKKSGDVSIFMAKRLESAVERKRSGISSIDLTLGLSELDNFTDGMKAGQMVVIAARPGCGKSVLGAQIAQENLKLGKKVGVITLEMTAEELRFREIASSTEINLKKLRTGDLTMNEIDLVYQHLEELGKQPIYYEDASLMNLAAFRSTCRRLKSLYAIDLIILDYLQLMDDDESDNRVQAITKITRTIKILSKELQIPIVVLAQLNRKPGDSQDSKPQLHHLRESGSIEQDADIVILLSRINKINDEETDSQAKDRMMRSEIATILDIAKQRNGPTVEITAILEGRYQKFSPLSKFQSTREIPNNWYDN